MRKVIVLLAILLSACSIFAEGGESSRRANPGYKKLKLYAHILNRYEQSGYYKLRVKLLNTGNKSISFWEDTNTYQYIFMFTCGGIVPVNKYERANENKPLKTKSPKSTIAIYRKIRINPHATYTIDIDVKVYDTVVFSKHNKNLKLLFHYEDANLAFCEDPNRPKILSENIITYDW